MKVLIFAFILFSCVVLVQSVPSVICNQTGNHPDAAVRKLVLDINKESYSEKKLAVLTQFLANSSKGFNGNQTVQILSTFNFVESMTTAIKLMDAYILQMTCQEVVNVLKVFSFSGVKLEVLPQIMNCITDNLNNGTIIDSFSFGSDKDKAKQILSTLKPRSCVFGTVKEPRVSFAIDFSPSMEAAFTDNTGKSWTRLSFVRKELEDVIKTQLYDGQEFNLAVFGGDVFMWKQALVKVSSTSRAESVIWMYNKNYIGGTNIYAALEKSFSDPNVVGVYLLSDGMPTTGVTDVNKILQRAKQLCFRNGSNIPVHTIAFLSGRHSGDDKVASKKFMQALAETCGGTFRSIE